MWIKMKVLYVPQVSVIIVNYNKKDLLGKCLESVFGSDYPNFEVVLVDNASTDESVELVKKKFGTKCFLKIIQDSENLGAALGRNIGVKAAKGEYMVFLDNDTEVCKNWLWELVRVLESDHTIGAAQCKLISVCDKKRFDSAGGLVDGFGFPVERGAQEKDVGQYDKLDEIFWAKGAAFAVRRNVLIEAGYFDSDYFLEYEEIDLCWRIWLRGYRIVFVPSSVVFHVGGGAPIFKGYHYHKNHITTLLKNYALSNLAWRLPLVIFLKVVAEIESSKSGQSARLKGILYNARNLRQIWIKRTIVQKYVRRKGDSAIFKPQILIPFSIILQENIRNARALLKTMRAHYAIGLRS
jgi:GT2 family glycosyltransferase